MAIEYVVAYYSYLDYMEQLSDAECGRLFRACLIYSKTGEAPNLCGNERFVWPGIKSQIDRDKEKYLARCKKQSENIRKRWDSIEYDGKNGIPADTKNTMVYDGINGIPLDTKNTKDTKEKENAKAKEKAIKEKTPTESKRKFSPPSLEEVREYCRQRKNTVKPEAFVDFYTSKGWMVGKTPMKDWKAAVRNWEHHEKPAAEPEKEDPYANVII